MMKHSWMGWEEIANALLAYGFVRIDDGKKAYSEGWKLTSRNFTAYVKHNNEDPLVIHPRHGDRMSILTGLPGVKPSRNHLVHNTSYSGFPRRHNKGKTTTNYGLDFGFSSRTDLYGFLDYLIGADGQPPQSAEDDIASASDLPSNPTELETVKLARRGQGKFRSDLIAEWTNCQATGCSNPALLRASHIKPWRVSSNFDRVSSNNGLLLSANMDAAFDAGLISFKDDGQILIASSFCTKDAASAGIHTGIRIRLRPANIPYLTYHRQMVWRGDSVLAED
jgi:hypothetical protein